MNQLITDELIKEGKDWVSVVEAPATGQTFSLRGPVKREGSHATVWVKTASKDGISFVALVEFDCAGKWRTLTGQGFDKSGNVLGASVGKQDWQYVYPDSTNSSMESWTCRGAPPANSHN